MNKERGQNPVVGDTLNLRLFSWDSNAKRDVDSFQKIEIYYLDPNEKTSENPEGRRLVESFGPGDVQRANPPVDGEYFIPVDLTDNQYVIGQYVDVWTFLVQPSDTVPMTWENKFQIYPNLWFMASEPLIYDFQFSFRPNRLRLGAKQWLVIKVTPNVPHASDLQRYYMNLAINSPMRIYMIQTCGDCLPDDEDERTIINGDLVTYREKCEGRYFLDTSTLSEGIYDIWFEMEFADSTYIGDRNQIQLY